MIKRIKTIALPAALLAPFVALCACSSNHKTSENVTSESPNSQPNTSPSGKQTAAQNEALVRFVVATPGNGMDLWFGDKKVFSNVAYRDVTAYTEVPAEHQDFKLQTAGNTQVNAPATASEGLTAGDRYTIVAEAHKGKLTLEVISDDLTPPASGKAKVRVINATNGLGKIDVVDSQGKVVTGVAPDSASNYDNVAPASGTLEIRRADRHSDIARVPNFTLDAAKLYTIIVVGGEGQPYQAIPVADQLTPNAPTGD